MGEGQEREETGQKHPEGGAGRGHAFRFLMAPAFVTAVFGLFLSIAPKTPLAETLNFYNIFLFMPRRGLIVAFFVLSLLVASLIKMRAILAWWLEQSFVVRTLLYLAICVTVMLFTLTATGAITSLGLFIGERFLIVAIFVYVIIGILGYFTWQDPLSKRFIWVAVFLAAPYLFGTYQQRQSEALTKYADGYPLIKKLAAYYSDKGEYPALLQDLVPQHMRHVPRTSLLGAGLLWGFVPVIYEREFVYMGGASSFQLAFDTSGWRRCVFDSDHGADQSYGTLAAKEWTCKRIGSGFLLRSPGSGEPAGEDA